MSSSSRQNEDGFVESTRRAKQRACIKWLLSKAFNNQVPDQLRDPFYTDHDGNQQLKPQIVVGLGNASIYCQVLANIYSDPNYQSLNHWSILQTLSRKGVPTILEERAGETSLTETVLIQTNPIRINAHMAVIEALMILYVKEITSGDRIHSAIRRLTSGTTPAGLNNEQLLLLWVSHVMAALKHRIDQEIGYGNIVDENDKKLRTPDIPAPVQDYTSLCDGVCLAYLIAYYCPKLMPWNQIRISYLPTVEDSIHNILLVLNFSQHHLPYTVFHMMPEDITYMRGHMKQNLAVLLADMFNVFEIHPVHCVNYPEAETATGGVPVTSNSNEYGIGHRRGFTCQTIQAIPDLRSGLNSPPSSASSQGRPPFQVNRSPSSNNIIHRHHTPPKEIHQLSYNNNGNMDGDSDFTVHRSKGITTLSNLNDPLIPAKARQSKEKTNNDSKADERGDVPAGRPSNWEEQRRTSFAGRRSRRNSFSEESQLTIENFGGSQDQLNMIGVTLDRRSQERERKISNASNVAIEPTLPSRSSIADARGTIQLGYESDAEKEDRETEKPQLKRQNSNTSSSNSSGVLHIEEKRKMASFASLASSTTTWQQQSMNATQSNDTKDVNQPLIEDTKLSAVRLKLEEKRRHIEKEKRKIEAQMSKQLQKVGKAAFLQAINKRDKSEDEVRTEEGDMVLGDTVEKPVSLQDIHSIDTQRNKKVVDLEHNNNISLEQYQQSIALMNTDLHDIQEDIQKLAEQQNQIQVQTMQAQQLLQAQQIANILNQQYSSQQNITGLYHPIQQPYGSTPAISMHKPLQTPQHHQYINEQGQYMNQKIYSRENSRLIDDQYSSHSQFTNNEQNNSPSQYLNNEKQNHIAKYVQDTNHYRDQFEPQPAQFFLHADNPQTPPRPPARRTWSQQPPPEMSSWSQQAQQNKFDTVTWKSSPSQQQKAGGFVLHTNGRDSQQDEAQRLFPVHTPQKTTPSQQKMPSTDDIMAPQSISFIGDEYGNEELDEADNVQISKRIMNSNNRRSHQMDDLEVSLGKLNITSGSRTYRIPSPTTRNHPGLASNSFQSMETQNDADGENEKGFYISFDVEAQPKRPKPPLRTKRSPKKPAEDAENLRIEAQEIVHKKLFEVHETPKLQHREIFPTEEANQNQDYERPRHSFGSTEKAIVISNDDENLDPMSVDEMERKKEKIMLLSLQRRQQQEEAKARKEIEAMQRKEREQEKDEEKAKRKEEQMARRAQILEQHRLKKAIEDAEREGKTLDRHTMDLLMKQQQQQQQSTPQPKMRAVKSTRPRPKTIHVESGAAVDIGGSGKKGSSSNLTGVGLSNTNSMRRDYYRGSQDSLAIKESPDEYPNTSCTPLGRRSSYKYGKEPQGIERGRTMTRISSVSKYGGGAQAGANFRGRKSNSLMNLCGDSDSGLGRATPPRRAPSPGMGSGASSGRHLPSPSGPGSLGPHPSLMKRRVVGYDDGASDISSTPSSIFGDYNGPRLYKQPATKSNRGILLNAVEYCVFPGVVNRDAKQKVLEKIARSEAKHFLVLFRDAGCQFRALYSYDPDTDTVIKLFGTGPTNVYDVMFDKFFKYNSGGKCFAQVHTKHLTVTCDAFTIHNSLWQGKKASNLPSKKDMTLVI